MAKTRRAYTGGAVETTTTSAIAASGTTTFTVSAATGWPYGTDPYHVVLSPGTASEEKVLVTRTGSGDTTINIASDSKRGQDGTSAVSHDSGATVYPVFTAVDADEANELTSMWEAKGDIITHGTSTFSRLAVGTNSYVLQADSSAASGLAWGQVATAGIADDAVTAAKIAAGAVDTAELAADAVNGTKIADNSIDSEHYVDGSIDTAHLAADAVTNAKIADDAVDTEHIADYALGDIALFKVAQIDWSSGSHTNTVTGETVYPFTFTETSDPDSIVSISSNVITFASAGLYLALVDSTDLTGNASGTSLSIPVFESDGTTERGGVSTGSVQLEDKASAVLFILPAASMKIKFKLSIVDASPPTTQSWSAGSMNIYKIGA